MKEFNEEETHQESMNTSKTLKAEAVNNRSAGWILKQNPKLAAITKARKEKIKTFKQYFIAKIENNKSKNTK